MVHIYQLWPNRAEMTSHLQASLSLLMGWSGSSWDWPKHRTRWYWSAAACRHSLLQYITCGGETESAQLYTHSFIHQSEHFSKRFRSKSTVVPTWHCGQAWCSSGRTRHSSWCGRLRAGMPLSLLAFSSAVSRARRQYSQAIGVELKEKR